MQTPRRSTHRGPTYLRRPAVPSWRGCPRHGLTLPAGRGSFRYSLLLPPIRRDIQGVYAASGRTFGIDPRGAPGSAGSPGTPSSTAACTPPRRATRTRRRAASDVTGTMRSPLTPASRRASRPGGSRSRRRCRGTRRPGPARPRPRRPSRQCTQHWLPQRAALTARRSTPARTGEGSGLRESRTEHDTAFGAHDGRRNRTADASNLQVRPRKGEPSRRSRVR